jgi:hypothetical protein
MLTKPLPARITTILAAPAEICGGGGEEEGGGGGVGVLLWTVAKGEKQVLSLLALLVPKYKY